MAGPTDPELIRFLRDELGETAAQGPWEFSGPLWLWRGKAKDGSASTMAWHFVTINGDVAEALRAASPGRTAAWGSIYVEVTIGTTTWRTSVFPSKDVGGFLLPIKGSVRKAQKLAEGDTVSLSLSV